MSWHPDCQQAETGQTGKSYTCKFRSRCRSKDCKHGGIIEVGQQMSYSILADPKAQSHS